MLLSRQRNIEQLLMRVEVLMINIQRLDIYIQKKTPRFKWFRSSRGKGMRGDLILLLEQRIFLSFSPLILSPLPIPAIQQPNREANHKDRQVTIDKNICCINDYWK